MRQAAASHSNIASQTTHTSAHTRFAAIPLPQRRHPASPNNTSLAGSDANSPQLVAQNLFSVTTVTVWRSAPKPAQRIAALAPLSDASYFTAAVSKTIVYVFGFLNVFSHPPGDTYSLFFRSEMRRLMPLFLD